MSQWKSHFPQASTLIHGQPAVYLDTAATALKPNTVIQRINKYYTEQVANVHRGAHYFADQGTTYYEEARERVAKFIGAKSSNEIVFTRGTTESINLIASSISEDYLSEGDEILLTELEHHSNIVPWQMAAKRTGAKIKVVPVDENGDIDIESYSELLSKKTKIVSFLYVSNALGTVNPLEDMIGLAQAVGAITVIDAAQSMTTFKTDVASWGCDFLVFSGHKIFGPTGIGVLYGKEQWLNTMPPYQGGGSMIDQVTFEATSYLDAPQRFEAGTPNIAGAIGLKAAIDFIEQVSIENIHSAESRLVEKAVHDLESIEGLRLVGRPAARANVVSFNIDGVHHGDVGALLDQQGIAVRVGHHCCQPLMASLGIAGTVRASFSVYNSEEDVNRLVAAVKKAKEFF